MRPLSYTSLRAFESCPLRWKLKYVDDAPPDPDAPERAPLRLGRAMHEALEAYHRGNGGPAAARRALAGAGVTAREAAEGHEVLREFHRRESRRRVEVLAVEKPFRVDLDGVPFQGIIDKIEGVPGSSRVAVVDYKSGHAPPAPWLARQSPQLGYYQLGAERALGHRVDHLAIEHVRSGFRFTSEPRRPDALAALVERAHDAWDRQRAGPWPATPGRDCPCEYASRCPYYSDLHPSILDWTGAERARVALAVEAYAATRDKDARADVEAHMRAHGTLRAWGTVHVAERTPGGQLRVRALADVPGAPAGADAHARPATDGAEA